MGRLATALLRAFWQRDGNLREVALDVASHVSYNTFRRAERRGDKEVRQETDGIAV